MLPLILPSIVAMFAASLVIIPDANPSLFLYDQLFATDRRFQRTFGGKRVWITGASSGIGAELAKQLHRHGARIILSGRREKELHDVAEEATNCSMKTSQQTGTTHKDMNIFNGDGFSRNGNHDIDVRGNENTDIFVLPFDVTGDDETIADAVSSALACYNGIDILILNAGSGQLSPAQDAMQSTTRALMEVNFMGPMRLALEVMKQDKWGQYDVNGNSNGGSETKSKKSGHIVVTSSVASKMALPLGTSYAASKHAVHGYFTSLRSECGEWLRVDLPCPGPIATNFQNKVLTGTKSQSVGSRNENKDDDEEEEDGSEVKMPADRCARLILSGMMGPASIMQETWISRQPTLTFMYLNQYFPNLSMALLGKIGPLRLKAFRAGLPLYQVSSWIKAAKMEKEQNGKVEETDAQTTLDRTQDSVKTTL